MRFYVRNNVSVAYDWVEEISVKLAFFQLVFECCAHAMLYLVCFGIVLA